MTGWLDDQNNPRSNFVLHRASSDAERGLPAVGKMVYRTGTGGVEVCVDTDPDPYLAGGGTWSPVGGAPLVSYSSWILEQGTTTFTLDQSGWYRTDGVECWGAAYLEITAGTGVSGWAVQLWGRPVATSGTHWEESWPWVGDIGYQPVAGTYSANRYFVTGSGDALGATTALAPGDVIQFSFRYAV